ncbi:hypothetical protein ABES02_29915 [Neobacillus pocheonensis]|uniref:hypothetical protein n=1 Tax=Neobacillus pocheonensis TaxID=363869 RepID=UPI003D29BA7B
MGAGWYKDMVGTVVEVEDGVITYCRGCKAFHLCPFVLLECHTDGGRRVQHYLLTDVETENGMTKYKYVQRIHAREIDKRLKQYNSLEELSLDDSLITAKEIYFKNHIYRKIGTNVNVARGTYDNLTAETFRNEAALHNLTFFHCDNRIIYAETGYSCFSEANINLEGLRMDKTLWHVSIWDWTHECDVAEEPYGYAVMAADLDEASELALKIHNDEKAQDMQDPDIPDAMKRRPGEARVDRSQSYEITSAMDKDGVMYYVETVRK